MIIVSYGVFWLVAFVLVALAELAFQDKREPVRDARVGDQFRADGSRHGDAFGASGRDNSCGKLCRSAWHRINAAGHVAGCCRARLGARLAVALPICPAPPELSDPAALAVSSRASYRPAGRRPTGLRNHPIEQLLALAFICPWILLLGAPVWAVVAVELALFASALFSHANLRLPPRWSDRLGLIVVTPAFHIVHHSAQRSEHDLNYGELLTLWDRLFGTYRSPCRVARLGLGDAADAAADRLTAQLYSPFARTTTLERWGDGAA